MEVYLVRHTTPDIAKGICYGQSDIGVTDSFEDEVQQIRDSNLLPKKEYTVYSSPLQRCRLLAERLFNQKIIDDNRLKELDFGDWELQAWDAIDKQEIDPWMNDFVHMSCPNGESYIDLYQRVLDFIKSIEKKSKNKKVIVVTHAGVIRSFLAWYNKVELKDSFQFKVNYAEVISIKINDNK